ncbi:hypothetical protein LOD99_13755 [Oopsacas minuta]|uniref:Uncharacterized protein n=1 Tax=Oopsacas minuta TaxID=111878 RepID=A0AAV7KJ26_9METZ|nr:hypothetical protein LOD99_13755 [Oopsacas minuta]
MQRKILIDALNKATATDSLIPGKAPPTPPRPMDPSQALQEEKIVYHITIDDLNIHEIFEHSLATMIRNRRELIKEIFSILAPHEIKAMLPESFRELKPKEVMKLCYMQLKEMPENHLTAIITCLADPTQCTIPVYKTMPKSKRSDSPSWRHSPKQTHDKFRDRSRSPAYKIEKPKSSSPKRTSSHSSDPQRHKSTQEKRARESSSRSSPSRKKSDKSPKKVSHKYSGESSRSKSESSDHKRLASSVHAPKPSNSKSKHRSSSKDKKQKKN